MSEKRSTHEVFAAIRERLSDDIVGMDETIRLLTAAIFAGGHCLLEGVPGLAKTLLISRTAALMGLHFSRIQFTPDLMPSDLTGAEVIAEDKQTGERSFVFLKGPIFANVVLADEINRTPPKTQAALMEAMEENQVTSLGKRFDVPKPFFVLATQNPIEQEGTYPLPAAQLDRFIFNLDVDYPEHDDERRIVRMTCHNSASINEAIVDRDEILRHMTGIQDIYVSKDILRYATKLVRCTRPGDAEAPATVKKFVSYGGGPRAAQSLVIGAKALAAFRGDLEPNAADIRDLIGPVLKHRVLLNFVGKADGISVQKVLDDVMASTDAPDGYRKPTRNTRRRFFGLLPARG